MDTITDNQSAALREAWQRIQASSPGIRIREAAKELDSSEAQLLATGVGEGVVRLKGPWTELLRRFKTLGRVMSLTRNDSCILEHKGTFDEVNIMDRGTHAMATVIGPIETRVFFQSWYVAFAVTEAKGERVLKSIQIFDQSGTAVTKIYLQEDSDVRSFEGIIQNFSATDQSSLIEISRCEHHSYSVEVSQDVFLHEWANLKDTHDFFGLLREHNVQRHHAMELGEHRFTTRVDPMEAPFHILQQASQSKLPIMIFAGNRGNLQIHQGTVRTIRVLERGHAGPERWLNVLDPDFNMHLKQNDIATAWLVKKPTTDGDVTSVELYDHHQELVVQFFGLRKPGLPEREEWRKLLNDLVSKK